MANEIITVKISELKETEHNPRQISKSEFEKLKKSLSEDPEFMADAREVVVDEDLTILGGHQRVKAWQALGNSEIQVKKVTGWSEEKKRRFVIKDNIQNGEWDMDELANAWSDLPLDELGLAPTAFEDAGEENELPESREPEVFVFGVSALGQSTDAILSQRLDDSLVAKLAEKIENGEGEAILARIAEVLNDL